MFIIQLIKMSDNEYDDKRELDAMEGAEYSKKSGFQKPDLVQDAVRKVIEAMGSEMRSGYFNYTSSNSGESNKVYVEDTRKKFMGTVYALYCLLSSEIGIEEGKTKGTMDMTFISSFESKKKAIFDERAVSPTWIDSNDKAIVSNKDRKYIPELDEEVIYYELEKTGTYSCKKIRKTAKGYWNAQVNEYWNEILELHQKLFSELNKLIASTNYFKQQTGY